MKDAHTQTVIKSYEYNQLIETINSLKNRLRNKEKTNSRRISSMEKSKHKIYLLNQGLKRCRKQIRFGDSLLKRLEQNVVIYDSLRNSNRTKRARRYSKQMKKFAISLYMSGPRTYRMIERSNVLCLPTKRTIKRWTSAVSFEPGLNTTILNALKEKCRYFNEIERNVVLAIDGMKIKAGLSYSAKLDKFQGFPDDGLKKQNERNRSSVLATEAVVVMVRGIYKPFKQGLGYFITHNTLGSKEQLKIVKNTIRAIRKAGLNPLVLTMDQFSTNIKMAKEAGVTIENPYFFVDGTPIFIWWDPPHLTKSTRNMIKKHNAVFNGNIASFVDIEDLYEIDCVSNPRLVPKLTEKHIQVPPFSPMNVSLATRTLSQSVATGIRYYVHTNELTTRALQTATFIEMHDKLFDVFNSKTKFCFAKPFKGALHENSLHWAFLDEAKSLLNKMFYTRKTCFDMAKAKEESKYLTAVQRKPKYVRGFLNNINSIRLLRRCGSNDSPNAVQFSAAFKYAAIETSLRPCPGGNCEPDNLYALVNSQSFNNSIVTEKHLTTNITTILPPLDATKPLEITTRELNGLMFVAGTAVRKLPHKKCVHNLVHQRKNNLRNEEGYHFIKLKQLSTSNFLNLPNKKLYDITALCFFAFNQKFSKFLSKSKVGVKTKLKRYINYDLFDDGICQSCFSLLIDKMFNTFIQGYLKKTKALQDTKSRIKIFKRNRKARRMCLPI
uniref:THAP-type domain-containing protein n=1 Tax=Anopheles epiroticus TaxID=199890 RepID=A0A182PX00_9DIPT